MNWPDGSRFSMTSTEEVPFSGETGRGRDTLAEGTSVAVVVGCASGASGCRDIVSGCLLGITELRAFRLTSCFVADRSSSWAVCSFTYSLRSWNDCWIGLSWIRGDTWWAGEPCTTATSGTKPRLTDGRGGSKGRVRHLDENTRKGYLEHSSQK